MEKERKKLEDAFKECEEEHYKRHTETIEEFYESMGFVPEEVYPEEDEKRDKYIKASGEYNNYCKKIELERIKQSILEDEGFRKKCHINWGKYTNFNESKRALNPVEYVRELRENY